MKFKTTMHAQANHVTVKVEVHGDQLDSALRMDMLDLLGTLGYDQAIFHTIRLETRQLYEGEKT
jgi:hypothetical protein